MGCYNISGFYSHLPIKYNDRIGAILCAKLDTRCDLAMNPGGTGISPIMAPIYGRYNDYGGIDFDISKSAIAFKNLTGEDINTFAERVSNNCNINIDSVDNGNKHDDVLGYQSVIKHLIPKHHGDIWCMDYDKKIKEAEEDGDDYMKETWEALKNCENEERKKLRTATFLFIFEHESILKKLSETGYIYMNSSHLRGQIPESTSEIYDIISNFVDRYDESIFYTRSAVLKASDRFSQLTDNVKGDYSDEEKNKASKEIDEIESDKCESIALCREHILITEHIQFDDYFGAVYKNQQINHQELKDDILDMLYIDKGLYYFGGTYNLCTYSGQDIYVNELEKMHQVMGNIINSIK